MLCLEMEPSFLQIGMCCSTLASDCLLLLNFRNPALISHKFMLKPFAVALVQPSNTGRMGTEIKL